MTFDEFEILQRQLFEERLKIAAGKGKEYSGFEDRLSNFKEEGKEMNISPLKVCHIFFNKHMRAIKSYINYEKEFSEETIRGRFLDAICYLELMYGLIYENSKTESKQSSVTKIKSDIVDCNSPVMTRIYRGGMSIVCNSCMNKIKIGQLYVPNVTGYNHYDLKDCYQINDNTSKTATSTENK